MSNELLSPQESLAKNGESFHWAKRFLGQKMGNDAAQLYAFCRLLDDMADGDIDNGPERLLQIKKSFLNQETQPDPILESFRPLMEEHDFPKDVIVALIDGLLSDQADTVEFEDEAELIRYAYRVAGTVGILMCKVLSCKDPVAHAHAIDLGIGMQLTNIARDVLEDAQLGRRYIPATWVNGMTPEQIIQASKSPNSQEAKTVTDAVQRLIDLAEIFYSSGNTGLKYLHWRAHLSISIAAKVYRQIGIQLEKKGCPWHSGREVTSKRTKILCSLRASQSLATRISKKGNCHDKSLHKPLGGLPFV